MNADVARGLTDAAAIQVNRHGTEVQVEVRATHLPQLFDAAALATFALLRLPEARSTALVTDAVRSALTAAGERRETRTLALTGRDLGELLVHWLRELLFLHETQSFVYTGARITRLDPALCAEVRGVRASAPGLRELKGITYHELLIHLVVDHWVAHISYET